LGFLRTARGIASQFLPGGESGGKSARQIGRQIQLDLRFKLCLRRVKPSSARAAQAIARASSLAAEHTYMRPQRRPRQS